MHGDRTILPRNSRSVLAQGHHEENEASLLFKSMRGRSEAFISSSVGESKSFTPSGPDGVKRPAKLGKDSVVLFCIFFERFTLIAPYLMQ